jgi:PAS domain-containing protein
MKNIKKYLGKTSKPSDVDFFAHFWEKSWTYIKTVVDVVREPVLILDKDFRVMAANEAFYQAFQVKLKDTEGKVVYELGNGQWDIPSLRTLLEDILPKQNFFKGFQVAHEFPRIGRRVMILNAREIHVHGGAAADAFPPMIMLAMEDVTDMMLVAESLSEHARQIEVKLTERIAKLEKEIASQKGAHRRRPL